MKGQEKKTYGSAYSIYAWSVLIYNALVIAWGAYVRASGSGAGCGSHWPACNGEVVPSFKKFETLIEFSHRVTSGFVLPLVLVLLFWTFKVSKKGNPLRKTVSWSLVFVVIEALVGAGLVRFGLVDKDDSLARAVVMSVHLANTFFLLGFLTLTAWWASGKPVLKLKSQGPLLWGLVVALLGVMVLGISGAVTALGDTLFPVQNLLEGLKQDFSPTAHFLVRLRLLHPLIALSVGIYLVLMLGLASYLRPSEDVKMWGRISIGVFAFQLILGLVNVTLRAPIELQLLHLFLADLLWVAVTIASVAALAEGVPKVEFSAVFKQEQPSEIYPQLSGMKLFKKYIALTKPKVISLLLFTTLTGMFIAQKGWPGFWLLFWVSIGGYMAAGAANAINMVIDRDIDQRMKRTSTRPTVTQEISSQNALLFAFLLALASFIMLWFAANLLCAMLALAGLAFYVVIYTLLLKRRTWHNIVIGGAAGAFPPLVGYAAITNELTPLAWSLFALVFVWTPVHFWALALLIKDDYAEAGIPMLPVVHGERTTILQIMFYAILTALISAIPFVQKDVGWFYLGPVVILNGVLFIRCFQLYQKPDRPRAVSLYKYSMVYLALVFLIMALDRT